MLPIRAHPGIGRRSVAGRRWLAVALALLAGAVTACGSAPAADPTEIAGPSETPIAAGSTAETAVTIARRVIAPGEGMPAVTGLQLDGARERLRTAGATGHALVFTEGGTVTAQYPSTGQPVDDTGVVLWVGAPEGVTIEVPTTEAAPLSAPGATTTAADDDTAGDDATASIDPTAVALEAPDGLTSWYGPGFEGDLTPCGERVDPTKLTFAGPDLPCGTKVRVTGPDGSTVEAVLTDRGPAHWTGRRYNLSEAAFQRLADLATGVLPVRVEVLD